MTPQARIAAAIEILDGIGGGLPAEQALLRWSRRSRFAGSGDRAAVRDLVFDALRCRTSYSVWGGKRDGRGLMLGRLRAEAADPAQMFTGQGHAPAPLSEDELAAGSPPDPHQQMNLPEWLHPLWERSLADQAGPIARAMSSRAPIWLRVNTAKATREGAIASLAENGVEAEADPRLPTALQVRSGGRRINAAAAYLEGWVELQDLSPQLACASLPLRDGACVLDYCAGGGGKALALAARADLSIDAHDAEPRRMADLPARAARAGATIRLVEQPQGLYDLVVADVPCSGSGTWRRAPDAKWSFDSSRLNELTQVQDEILATAALHVGPGGHLAYMTCSLLREENDDRVAAFLAASADFQLIDQRRWSPMDASDGFFLALFRKSDE
ncbi:RsmB/NOP family class I SAM-dependent RNA methyltransferase [Paracoccus tegillarcae]|uniref:SAM-dependent methyltransferase n=1 Tax=Paracoccus tegillarcae TaxID=1529068 RepID=A0A2K9EN62_9RHOB|nr:RsmB/NOP family class I SAM-dependent RNA methyltransferase [Paracoccus tegillarcae]AUH32136.1 SAM-dependent methyltransferase [Paracoccus tegillarcae]